MAKRTRKSRLSGCGYLSVAVANVYPTVQKQDTSADHVTAYQIMKNIITSFSLRPFEHTYPNCDESKFIATAQKMVAELGQAENCLRYGDVVCRPHAGLELVMTPGPKKTLAVQVLRMGTVVLVGIGRIDPVYPNTIKVMVVSDWFMPHWHHYAFNWSVISNRQFRRIVGRVASRNKL